MTKFISKENLVLFVLISMISVILTYYSTKNINLRIAFKGYGPQNYVTQKLHPENFEKDFMPETISIYDNSPIMRIFPILKKNLDIDPSNTVYPYMFIQTFFFLLSIAFLSQALFQNKFVTLISVMIIPFSDLAGLNLSRFGAGYGSFYSYPLYYGYANALRIFALYFFLRNKYTLCFVFLALSIYCHVNMGLCVLAFIGGYFLIKPRLFFEKSVIVGILVFIAMTGPHIYSIISNAIITSGSIPLDEWVKATRFHGHHWYSIKLGVFTNKAHIVFFPFLLSTFSYFIVLRYQRIKNENYIKIIAGSTICLIMSLVGLIFSDIYPIPFLIKLSLQRFTGLITFFGVLYLIYYLYRKIENFNIVVIFLAVYSLLMIAFSMPGIAILPLFFLLYFDIRENYFGYFKLNSANEKIIKKMYFTALFLLLLLTLICVFKDDFKIIKNIFEHLWTPLQFFNPAHKFDFIFKGGTLKVSSVFICLIIAFMTAFVVMNHKFKRNQIVTALIINFFVMLSLSTIWYFERSDYLKWYNRYGKIASAYMDVQLWAKNNTVNDALFMPDPTHYYGWRDFSERSSFGNLREWGFISFLYNSDYELYLEGKKRLAEFGFDILEEDRKTLIKSYKNFRKTFYDMDSAKLKSLSKKYKIDYVVMSKKYQKIRIDSLDVGYENEHYIVYRLTPN